MNGNRKLGQRQCQSFVCDSLHLRNHTGKSSGQRKDEKEKKVKIKVSGTAGGCATAGGDSAANDKMTVCKEI